MKREELPNEASREDKMREALAHYEELATKACWHRSDIPEAIRAHYAPLPPAEGADPKKVQWSGYGPLGNISQKPLQPTAEGATDKFRGVLNEVQRYIETNGGATESEMKAIWNSLSCAITESERRSQPTAEGAEEILAKGKVLMYGNIIVDPIMLPEGIYATKELRIYLPETTIEHLIEIGKMFRDKSQTQWLPDSYFDNLSKCELIDVGVVRDATLHAQRLAEKMVSERLREELIGFADWLDKLSPSGRTSVWSKSGEFKGLFTMDNEQLLEKYLKARSHESK